MITQKRDSLERFLREQTIGPGGSGRRFMDLDDQLHWPSPEIPALEVAREVINSVPGNIYSTGILFPVDESREQVDHHHVPEETVDEDEDLQVQVPEEQESDPGGDEDVDPELDSQSLNQMYPNTMGMTVCLNRQVIIGNDLSIEIYGRYYRKIRDRHRIVLYLEDGPGRFEQFLQSLPADDIIRTHIRLGRTEMFDHIQFQGDAIAAQGVKDRMSIIQANAFQTLIIGIDRQVRSLAGIKEFLFLELKSRVLSDSPKGAVMIGKLKQIEELEYCAGNINDLLNIINGGDYGIWKCESFSRTLPQIDIPENIRGRIIHDHRTRNDLNGLFHEDLGRTKQASLSVNLQLSVDKRDNGHGPIYLKVQLLNTSSHFTEEDTHGGRNYFSMASEEINKRCFFGVGIQINSTHLIPGKDLQHRNADQYDEDEVTRYIYRQYEDYGVGHACSVRWGENNGINYVASEYIPAHETPEVDTVPRNKESLEEAGPVFIPSPYFDDPRFLSFKWLSDLSDIRNEEVLQGLEYFVTTYGNWISRQTDTAQPNLAAQIRTECARDQQRMLDNVRLLLSPETSEALRCFRMMNTAMFMQLWHGQKVKRDQMDPLLDALDFRGFTSDFYKLKADDRLFSDNEGAAWRPFQLAFILLNLDGIFRREDDPEWAARNHWVDLVWFPTGGGKTEAYLGLIALTLIDRRRRHNESGGGTAVIMRYTLRLLTTQQFQRATLLIMALELMRRWGTANLGTEPIYIGLFVGRGSLPNKLSSTNPDEPGLLQEYEKMAAAQQHRHTHVRTKIPLSKCPWCGHKLDPVNYREGDRQQVFEADRILLSCSRANGKCSFSTPVIRRRSDHGPIPVSLCDEEIYKHPPALLFGTVDKFAQLAHKASDLSTKMTADSRRLFGRGTWEAGKPRNGYLTPDMIIQDELHLMLGPLGSAVALFESAINELCVREQDSITIRPKVISSTATTRNTSLQIMALFDRKVNIFPKPGVHCDDSFFAFYKRNAMGAHGAGTKYLSKRKYIGILPTGRTQMWMQFRIAAILFVHRAIFESKLIEPSDFPLPPGNMATDALKAMDHYHTVVSYFNSLREVGKTESQLYTYLIKEIRRVFNRVIRQGKLLHPIYTYESSFNGSELTGRLSGEEVVGEMERISRTWSPYERFAHRNAEGNVVRGQTPPDMVIATNMISVGIDISRLNSLIMNCMPRNIAEYIQASSRVAREEAGIVITVHHPFRSRDLSHYERFIEFHEKMYSYVEPISITPFTQKALQRYLPLYLATMIRHRAGYPDRLGANVRVNDQELERLTALLIAQFRTRMETLQALPESEGALRQLLTEENLSIIYQLTRQAIRDWGSAFDRATAQNADLVFNDPGSRAARTQVPLYVDIDEYSDNIHSDLWSIPQSLRVVDPEAVIHIYNQ